jgi:hypothetical protein
MPFRSSSEEFVRPGERRRADGDFYFRDKKDGCAKVVMDRGLSGAETVHGTVPNSGS